MGQLKSHGSQNPIKQKDMKLKILGKVVLEIINILEHNPCENNLIRMIKNHQTSKGGKGQWKGEKGR